MDFQILPECYIDTNLIETLVPPQHRGYSHQTGCGSVARKMQHTFANDFALGIIDKDKAEIAYLKEFTEVIAAGNLRLHKHTNRNHYIIQIQPAIERFMLDNAIAAAISLNDYGLPTDFTALKKRSKSINSRTDHNFKSLFKALKRAGTPEINRLAAWITYLRNNPYNADTEELRGM